jgi:hypothetical protein
MQQQVLNKFFAWLSFLMRSLPPKSKPTLIELIIGAMISASGHVTEAILAIKSDYNWTTYYKMIESGKFSWVAIVKNLTLMLSEIFFTGRIVLAVDDTLVQRSSEKAPGADIHFDHAAPKNKKCFVLSQLFVSIFFIARGNDQRTHALPLCMMMAPKSGNSSKLRIALMLARTAWRWLAVKQRQVLLLCDSWYMKSSLILPLLDKNIHVIGQVRRDTALFMPPKTHSGRGRPRKYGAKISKDDFQNMADSQTAQIFAYGKIRPFEFYEFSALAKFLNGKRCKALWCRFMHDDGKFTNWRLLISTDTSISAQEILSLYSSRWAVEPAFNSLKNSVGVNNAWQQSKKTSDRWRCLLCCAYCLSVLSEMFFGNNLAALLDIPWRRKQPMTAAWAARALKGLFGGLCIRACWDRKNQKLTPPQ